MKKVTTPEISTPGAMWRLKVTKSTLSAVLMTLAFAMIIFGAKCIRKFYEKSLRSPIIVAVPPMLLNTTNKIKI